MRNTWLFLIAFVLLPACSAPIGPEQPDGADCNVAEEHPCGGDSYCDEGAPGSAQRTHEFGFMSSGSHAVGTCRPRGATGAPCNSAEGCVNRNCTHATPDAPGFCGP